MSGVDFVGLSTVCETCDDEIEFPDDLGRDVGICRQCGEAFLIDVSPASVAEVS